MIYPNKKTRFFNQKTVSEALPEHTINNLAVNIYPQSQAHDFTVRQNAKVSGARTIASNLLAIALPGAVLSLLIGANINATQIPDTYYTSTAQSSSVRSTANDSGYENPTKDDYYLSISDDIPEAQHGYSSNGRYNKSKQEIIESLSQSSKQELIESLEPSKRALLESLEQSKRALEEKSTLNDPSGNELQDLSEISSSVASAIVASVSVNGIDIPVEIGSSISNAVVVDLDDRGNELSITGGYSTSSNDGEHDEPEPLIDVENNMFDGKDSSSSSKGEWPSKSYSAFNFKSPGNGTWETNSKMGAGENYPGINKKAVSSQDATQGIAGPEASFDFGNPLNKMYVTSFFGWRKSFGRIHYGIDLRAANDTPVYATARGTVTWFTNSKGNRTFGKVIELNHGDGFTSTYAHLNKVLVSEGDHVEKGQLIAYSGSTAATAPHLHFEIRNKGIPFNPFMGYLKNPNE